jgi:hypothetical protein
MNDRRVNRWIACHFIWTVAVAATFFRPGEPTFQFILLVNAGSAAVIATARRESLRLRRLTLWDEAIGLVGVSAAAGLLR